MLLFLFLSFGALLFSCVAKNTSKTKNIFMPKWSVLGGFSVGCSGIEKLNKKNPKRGGVAPPTA